MKLHLLIVITALLSAPLVRAEDEKPPTEVAVHVGKVARATLRRMVTAYGSIEPEPAEAGKLPASAKLSPALAGIVAEVNGVEGQRVEKGAVLFRLDSRAVDAAVAKAELTIAFAQKNADRQKKLIAAEGTSEKQVLEAEQALAAAQTELATAKVQQSLLRGEAPLSGTLVRFSARPGEAADATTVLAEIVDLDRVVATVRVPRAEAANLKAGLKAELRTNASDAKPIAATVAFVSPQVDAASATVLVRVALPKDAGLIPGDFVSARIVVEERADKLAVPRASVYTDGEGKTTLSIVEGDTAKQKVVKAGLRDGDLVEVEGEGVTEGATVVTTGSYALPEQTKVRILNTTADAK
jgi:membrane fusion protein (multidrug efflux system)